MTNDQFTSWADLLPEPILLLEASAEASLVSANAAAASVLMVSRTDLPGVRFVDIASRPDGDLEEFLRACRDTRSPIGAILRLTRGDGSSIACEVRGARMEPEENGGGPHVLLRLSPQKPPHLTVVDAGAARKARRPDDAGRIDALLDQAPVMVTLKDPEGRYLYVNQTFERAHGLQRAEVVERTDYDIFPRDFAEASRVYDEHVVTSGQAIEAETTAGDEDTETWYGVRFCIADPETEGRLVGSISLDITNRQHDKVEEQRKQVQVLQTQKLESLGVLAGGIAHDFNNLLLGIMGNTSLALTEVEPDSELAVYLTEIEGTAQRAAELCRQMLAYSGKGRFVLEGVDLSEVVDEMRPLIAATVGPDVIVRYLDDAEIPRVEADAAQIKQVILNLVNNAGEAIGDEPGVITVTTGALDCDYDYLSGKDLEQELKVGTYAFIEISDTGCGIDDETRDRIFDPFFTTKFTGRGLGLAAVLGIVRGHRGAIKVYSKPGRGTTFRVYFPAASPPATEEVPRGRRAARPVQTGTILVVDDEETVRKVCKAILSRAGFSVLTAANGREGVEVFRRHQGEITAVLLDMTMPYMGGYEAFREMKAIDEHAVVILSSGYDEQEATSRFAGKGLAGFIQKPYMPNTLLEAIGEILGRHRGEAEE